MARRLHSRRLTAPDSNCRTGTTGRHQKARLPGLGVVGYTGLAGIILVVVVAAAMVVLPRGKPDVSAARSWADTGRTPSRVGGQASSRRLTMPGAAYRSAYSAESVQTTTTLAPTVTSTASLPECTGVPVGPGDNVQAKLNANLGATFCFQSGVYETGGLLVRAGQRLIGQPGAMFDGTKQVSNWTRTGDLWVSTGQTFNPKVVSPSSTKRECEARPANCHYADLWVDGRRQQRVLSVDQVGPGSWHWDYAADKVYLGTDPQGKTVRLTNQRIAFQGSGYAVRGFTIRRYGENAIVAGQNVTLQGNDVVENHGLAMKVGTGSRVLANHIRDNGQYGIVGSGKGIVVEGNEIAFNNNLHFANSNGGYWNAGATKFVYTDGLVFRGNHSHDNYSDGYWTDINNINTLVENNRFEGNERYGVNHEISYAITIRDNTITGNRSAGIWVNSSPNAQVYGNTLSGNGNGILITDQNRGTGAYGEWTLKNASIHDNTISAAQGATGALGALRLYSQNNHFEGNHYLLDILSAKRFRWRQTTIIDFRQWQGYGNDDDGGTAAVSGA
jgi:parallel beta-helix repeat protein